MSSTDIGLIRPAIEKDLAAIDRIYNQAVEEGFRTAHLSPLTVDQREMWFQDHDPLTYPVFVFTRGAEVLGWASFSPYRPGRKALNEVAEISIYVDFEHHGEGIGSKMLEYCLARCPDLNKRVVFSIIIEGNQGSIGLMQKYGFEQWGFLPDVISHNNQKRGHFYMGKIVRS